MASVVSDEREAEPAIAEKIMKYLASLSILIYGGVLTFGLVFLSAFGSSFAGMGAGTAGSAGTSDWAVWPCPVFFILSAVAPFKKDRKKKVTLLRVALSVMILGSLATYGMVSGLIFAAVISVASLLAWVPLLADEVDPSNSRATP